MQLRDVSLSDRYDLAKSTVLLNGSQALVRATLMQRARDEASGLNTAGFVTGYRGSPLGAIDQQMRRAQQALSAAHVRFEPGINEDVAATALWGSQQAELRGEGKYDGVFGMWYGKGPGVDRTGDVFRHANLAGTSKHGGVIACAGDDHTAESSTTLHHSEFALMDAMMPVLSPAGLQEVIDYALIGWRLSRFSGAWVGLKCVKDTIEVTQVVNGDPNRLNIIDPQDFALPPDGLNIRLADTPHAQEARLYDTKIGAAEAFARANRLDRRKLGRKGARIGVVSSGKSWLDTAHALDLLGIDDATAEAAGITAYKVAMVWPLDIQSFLEWAEGLDLIIVVEEKRKLIEGQIKEALFNDRHRRRVLGWKNDQGETLFPCTGALNPAGVADILGHLFAEEGVENEVIQSRRATLEQVTDSSKDLIDLPARHPYFCSGCPHNSSTRVPEGSRAYAGIGCHYMVQWMDRSTEGYTHMGGEGANWVGEAPFSKTPHVFQNIGDGTYNHSGVQSIRAALASDANMTFKILYNDAVALTGGQGNDGGLDAPRIAHELIAMGVREVVCVFDPKEDLDRAAFPQSVALRPRSELAAVQRSLRDVSGVTAIIYVQTCAAEKRRRRKRGAFPDPKRRVFINPAVCEGCGDCGVQSNCVAIAPLETAFGQKRRIDQSACNKDFTCLEGLCPSFVTLEGAEPRRLQREQTRALPNAPDPEIPAIDDLHSIVITGVGGAGVVTIGAVLAMAAHLEGKGVGVMEMAGLAQKGGAVYVHCRLAENPEGISAVRVAPGEADALIGGDLVVAAGSVALGLVAPKGARAVVNTHEIMTGDFARDRGFSLPFDAMMAAIRKRFSSGDAAFFDATKIAERQLGDAVYSNMLMLGAAWQNGLLPLDRASLRRAIELNGASVEQNLDAFELGRLAVANPEALFPSEEVAEEPEGIDQVVRVRAEHIVKYQNADLAARYRHRVEAAAAIDQDFGLAMASGYHKLLTYKDEYEVARLHTETLRKAIDAEFDNVRSIRFHLAPPVPFLKETAKRPRKRTYGPWMLHAFGVLSKMKWLRGRRFDPFGQSAERKLERALITEYEQDMDQLMANWSVENTEAAVQLAELPLEIRGFGTVKLAAAEQASRRRAELLNSIERTPPHNVQAAE